VISHFR